MNRLTIKPVIAVLMISLLLISSVSLPVVDAGKGTRIVGSMKDDGRILLLVQNASDNDLYSLMIESFSGDITAVNPADGWISDNKLVDNTIVIKTINMALKSGESIRFYISLSSEEPKLKFKWSGYVLDGAEVAKGAFTTTNRLAKVEESEQPAVTVGIKPITEKDIRAKYGDKYPAPKSDNGNSVTEFGYLWNKDPLTVNIIIAKNMQREDKEYNFAKLITEALQEWQYKLRKASHNEKEWGFEINVIYEGDEFPNTPVDITISVRSGNYLEYLGYAPCYTPAYVQYLEEQNEDQYSNKFGKRGEKITSLEEWNKWYREFHAKYEHGNIAYCTLNLEVYMASYAFTIDGYSIVPAGKLSRAAFKDVAKHEIGHVLGLGHTINGPLTSKNMDIMSDGYQQDAVGWQPDSLFEHYISQYDIDALLQLYGRDGFGGENNMNHPLKDPCFVLSFCQSEVDLPNYHQLELKLQLAKDLVSMGDSQKIFVKVTTDGKPVAEADVSCIIVNSEDVTQKEFSHAFTDSTGDISYTWLSKDIHKSGTYTVKCKVTKESNYDARVKAIQHYTDGNASIAFEVI